MKLASSIIGCSIIWVVSVDACYAVLPPIPLASTLEGPVIPDMNITPGAIDPKATKEKVCTPGYTKTVRSVPDKVKKEVAAKYSVDPAQLHWYEIDHDISLELGGSNSSDNLFPQSYLTKPYNARIKDKLENFLHRQVCKGAITLKKAQEEIYGPGGDWRITYRKYFGEPK
jgi:hypothetical protein